jgi:hypothetical protein
MVLCSWQNRLSRTRFRTTDVNSQLDIEMKYMKVQKIKCLALTILLYLSLSKIQQGLEDSFLSDFRALHTGKVCAYEPMLGLALLAPKREVSTYITPNKTAFRCPPPQGKGALG